MKKKAFQVFSSAATWLILAMFLFATLLPFYWMVLTSLKPNAELFSSASPLIVVHTTIAHYQELFERTQFAHWFANSVIVAGATTLLSLALGSLAAYGVSRATSRLAPTIARIVLIVYLIPRVTLLIPLYELMNSLHLLDSLFGLIIAYLSFCLPYSIWMLISYFNGIPRELDEAALIDGATPFGALWNVILPVVGPALVAVSIFTFSMCWNEYMYPLTFIQTNIREPFTVGIAALQQGDVFSWGQLMASGTVTAIPTLIAYSLIQRHIVSGLTAGAVKG